MKKSTIFTYAFIAAFGAIIVGLNMGGISGAIDLIEKDMWRVIREEAIPYSADAVKIVPAQLNENIGDISSLVLAVEASKKQ